MTAQISNIFKINEKEYELLGQSNELNFSPRDYGLVPIMLHTGNLRGYFYEANIVDEQLVIENLFVNNENENYLEINGVEAVDEKDTSGYGVYYNVNIPLTYTGKILLGYGFISRYYEHMGFQKPHTYQELILLTFVNGKVVDAEDISERAERIREDIDKDLEAFMNSERDDLTNYIEESFSQNIGEEYL